MELEQLLYGLGYMKNTEQYECNYDDFGVTWKIEKSIPDDLIYVFGSKKLQKKIPAEKVRTIINQLNDAQIRCTFGYDEAHNSITVKETVLLVVRAMSETKLKRIIAGLGAELMATCYMLEVVSADESKR